MPLEGLSEDSMNFVLFWENDTFSVRGAYNYRDSFLSNRSNTQGNPVFTDTYGQFDLSANWNISDHFTLLRSPASTSMTRGALPVLPDTGSHAGPPGFR